MNESWRYIKKKLKFLTKFDLLMFQWEKQFFKKKNMLLHFFIHDPVAGFQLSKMISVPYHKVPLSIYRKNFYKISYDHIIDLLTSLPGQQSFFLKNRALPLLFIYGPVTSCEKNREKG